MEDPCLTAFKQLGRKRMYGLELIVIIFATLAQALSSGSASMDVIGVVIFWRVIMVRISLAGFICDSIIATGWQSIEKGRS